MTLSKSLSRILVLVLLGAIHSNANAQTEMRSDQVAVMLIFNPINKQLTRWDGEAKVEPGEIVSIDVWRHGYDDKVEGKTWKVAARRKIPMSSGERKRGYANMPFQNNGVVLTLSGVQPAAKISVTTAQGDFSFTLGDIPYGKNKRFLKGGVVVNRVPASTMIVSAPTEDDYPSASVGPDGVLYVAYIAFTHGKDFRVRRNFSEMPTDFSSLSEPTGGDQIFLTKYSGRRWNAPAPVTEGGGDLYRTALVIDGEGRVWIVWSANVNGNWDIYARSIKSDKFSERLRLSNDSGSDIDPVATADSEGKVWIAWQGFRGNNSNIFAVRQEGDKFGSAITVSDDPANEWEPTIAASRNGEVAVAWDTYSKGDYDVYCRVAREGRFAEPIPIAATLKAEKQPSITYDGEGRLWVAYEEAGEKWGKDQGYIEKGGLGLYRGRQIAIRVLDKGRLYAPSGSLTNAIFGRPGPKARGVVFTVALGFQLDLRAGVLSENFRKKFENNNISLPEKVAITAEGSGRWRINKTYLVMKEGERLSVYRGRPRRRRTSPVAVPRLAADANGRVWLAARTRKFGARVGVGTVWTEHLTYYEGGDWIPAVLIPNTDNLLDNRPAIAPARDGNIYVVSSSDGRQATSSFIPWWLKRQLRRKGVTIPPPPKPKWGDRVNNELYAANLNVSLGIPPAPELKPVSQEVAAPSADAAKERKDVNRMREYRTQVGGKTLRLMRGEFHRHTEISSDGGGDGTLLDMWRYALDAASMDWIGNGDHDNGNGREYSWWIIQKTTDVFHIGDTFAPMFSYERSCGYPDGHRNVVFAKRGIRTLPRLNKGRGKPMDNQPDAPRPNSPDTQMLYKYLHFFDGICAEHTSGTNMGTDWRDNDPKVEPIVEIYQGCRQSYEMPGAPRSNTAEDSAGGWRPLGFVSLALNKGYRLGFQSSSDHGSTHISYCNVWVEAQTREAILAAMKRRHIYGSTDNIVADVKCGEHFMGDEFVTKEAPMLSIKLIGAQPFAKVHIIKDNEYVYTTEPKKQRVEFTWTDRAPTKGFSYYYVRGEQEDGELVWVSPMWIKWERG